MAKVTAHTILEYHLTQSERLGLGVLMRSLGMHKKKKPTLQMMRVSPLHMSSLTPK